MHYIVFYYCWSSKAIADINKGRETTRRESLKTLKAGGRWVSQSFEDPSSVLLISSQLLQDLQLVHPWLLLFKECTRCHEIKPEGVEDDNDEAVYGWLGPGGAPGGDAGAVVPVAVEVELRAGEEEAAREEVDGQRVEGEDSDEEQRPRAAPGGPVAAARQCRHQLRQASYSSGRI